MKRQDYIIFADALRQALQDAGKSQAELARELRIDPSQVNRWVNGRAIPQIDNVRRIQAFLKVDLSDSFAKSIPQYELFVSAPISAIETEEIAEHHDAVAMVVAAANEHVNHLIWPGDRIRDFADRRTAAADLATERNMKDLANCPAYLYLQFSEIIGPSSALVELGFALGRKMKVTIIVKHGLTSPYMLRGFGAVAARLSFLPEARIYEVDSPNDAASLIAGNGRELFGLV